MAEHGPGAPKGHERGSMRSREDIAALLGPVESVPVAPAAPEGPVTAPDWRNTEQRAADQRRQQHEREGRAAAARRALERASREPVVEMVDRKDDAIHDEAGDVAFEAQHKKVNEAWEAGEAEDKARRKLPWRRGGPAERADRRTREEVAAREAVKAAVKAERDKVEAIVGAPDWAEQQRAADQRMRSREDQHHVAAVGRERTGPASLREVGSVFNPEVRERQQSVIDQELLDLAAIDLDAIPTPGVAVERPEPTPPRAPVAPDGRAAAEAAHAEERRRATGTPRRRSGPVEPLMEPEPVSSWEPVPAERTSWRERGAQAAAGARQRLTQAAAAANRARLRVVQAAGAAGGAFARGQHEAGGGGDVRAEAQVTPPAPEGVVLPAGGVEGVAAGELRLPDTEVRRPTELVRAEVGEPMAEEEWPELGPAAGETTSERPVEARTAGEPESGAGVETDPRAVANLRSEVDRLRDDSLASTDWRLRQLLSIRSRTGPGGVLDGISIPIGGTEGGDSAEEVSARDYIDRAILQVRAESPETEGGQPT